VVLPRWLSSKKKSSSEMKMWVQSWGWEDPWRREMLPTLVFWPEEFHRLYSPWGLQKVGHDRATFTSLFPKITISFVNQNLEFFSLNLQMSQR